MERIHINSKDHKIPLTIWKAENPKGILQILHGMGEYVERYNDFALFLVKSGYTVVAHDHRGHGKNIDKSNFGFFAKEEGWDKLNIDAKKVNDYIAIKYPKKSIYILGHSMGSFVLRDILYRYKSNLKVNGAIIMGTGNPSGIKVLFGYIIASIIGLFKGESYKSKLITKLTFQGYYGRFKNSESKNWLSTDNEKLTEFKNYKFYKEMMPINFYKNLYKGIFNIKKDKNYNIKTKLLILSGGDDILGNFGKDVKKVIKKYSKYTKVKSKLYKKMRHEILNEKKREIVYKDILNWLNNRGE